MQKIIQGWLYVLKIFGLLIFIVISLMVAEQCSTPAFAQQGIIPAPELSVEEQLSVDGPIRMGVIWDYIEYAFGAPQTASDVLVFHTGIPTGGNIFHIQAVDTRGNVWHVDIELDKMSPGGANAEDGSIRLVWFCRNEDVKDLLGGCPLPLASWVVGYDAKARTALHWPKRIQQ